jgi:N-glycosylase/DNA lyase
VGGGEHFLQVLKIILINTLVSLKFSSKTHCKWHFYGKPLKLKVNWYILRDICYFWQNYLLKMSRSYFRFKKRLFSSTSRED